MCRLNNKGVSRYSLGLGQKVGKDIMVTIVKFKFLLLVTGLKGGKDELLSYKPLKSNNLSGTIQIPEVFPEGKGAIVLILWFHIIQKVFKEYHKNALTESFKAL